VTVTEIRPGAVGPTVDGRWAIQLQSTFDLGYDCKIQKPWPDYWLMAYDPDAMEGLGRAEFSPDVQDALRFVTFNAAREFWMQQSTVMPTRYGPAGTYENRPLALATHIAIVEV
jgi:hypothetical protein